MKYYSFTELRGRGIHATDGDMGECTDVLVNSGNWAVRYLVVDTRKWLPGRHVVLAPQVFQDPFRLTPEGNITVRMDKEHVRKGPPLPFDQTITSERMIAVHAYYGWPAHWGGTGTTAADTMPLFPASMEPEMGRPMTEPEEMAVATKLRSLADLREFALTVGDERVGYLHDFVIDTEDWTVAYIIIDSRKWITGTRHIFRSGILHQISWLRRSMSLNVSAREVRDAPTYDPDLPISEQVSYAGTSPRESR